MCSQRVEMKRKNNIKKNEEEEEENHRQIRERTIEKERDFTSKQVEAPWPKLRWLW